jgi:hypothetical protein
VEGESVAASVGVKQAEVVGVVVGVGEPERVGGGVGVGGALGVPPGGALGVTTLRLEAARGGLGELEGVGALLPVRSAVTLGEALRFHANDFVQAFDLYQQSRIARTARIVLSAREMGRIYHAKGVERLVRNDLWRGRSPERFYDALEWLYGWRSDTCLAIASGS